MPTPAQIIEKQRSPITPEQTVVQSAMQTAMGAPKAVDPNLTQEAFTGNIMTELSRMKNRSATPSPILTSGLATAQDSQAQSAIDSAKAKITNQYTADGQQVQVGADGALTSSDGGNTWQKKANMATAEQTAGFEAMKVYDDLQKTREANLQRQKENIEAQTRQAMAGAEQTQKAARGAAGMQLARMGALGNTASGLSYVQNLERTQQNDLNNMLQKSRQLISEAEMAYEEGNAKLAIEKSQAARQAKQDFLAEQRAKNDDLFKAAQLQKLNHENAVDFFKDVANSGFKFSDVKDYAKAVFPDMPEGQAEGLFSSTFNALKLEKAKSETERMKAEADMVDSMSKIAKYLPKDQQLSFSIGGKAYSVSAKDVRQTKQYQISTPKGNEIVTVDEQTGEEISRITIGKQYVAPFYDTDRGVWKAYNPTTDTEDIIQDNGEFGEGAAAIKDSQGIVDFFKKTYRVTQEPGDRFSHSKVTAWDFGIKANTALKVPVSGVVKNAGFDKVYGNYVDVLDAQNGYIVRLGHLNRLNVQPGDSVTPETILGLSGSTGKSTGPHLHLELRTADNAPIRPGDLAKRYQEAPQNLGKDVQSFLDSRNYTSSDLQRKSVQKELGQYRDDLKKEQTTIDRENRNLAFDISSKITTDPSIKPYMEVAPQVKKMEAALQSALKNLAAGQPVAAQDQTIIIAFNKLLDEGSVVREGEYARTTQGQSVVDRLQGYFSKFEQGGAGITPRERENMVSLAREFAGVVKEAHDNRLVQYMNQALVAGVNPLQVLPTPPSSTFNIVDLSGNIVGTADASDLNSQEMFDLVQTRNLRIQLQ